MLYKTLPILKDVSRTLVSENLKMLSFQNAVLALNSSALDIDQVENLIKFCPTKEEMTMLKVLSLSGSLV